MKTTYLFYDLETSGLSKPFDQIQQFAGKRLNENWEEVESSFLEARISPDVIPSPYAVITHQICMGEDSGRMSEFQATTQIHAMMNEPATISLGYNTLGFDDEFLRFAFYRNLLSPYTHQYANGCKRYDIFPLTVFYFLFEKSVLKWPQIDGKPTLKLEHIVTENNWFQGRAHHAMNDVDATIKLASHLRKGNPAMWNYLIGYFDKGIDSDRIAALPKAFNNHIDFRFGVMIHSKFGASYAYSAMVLALGNHNHYKNQTVWLRLDKEEFEEFDFEKINASGFIIRKKYAEPGFMLPPSENYTVQMSLDRMKIVEKNLAKISEDFSGIEDIQRQAREFMYESVENIDVDAGLYDNGFLTHEEQAFCRQFHLSPPKARQALLDGMKNSNLHEQALRALWRDSGELNSKEALESIEPYIKKILQSEVETGIFDYRGEQKRGIFVANQEVSQIESTMELDRAQEKVLESFKQWMQNRSSE
ncbi:MAG: exonuclease domain-containing protein [Pseudomonadota bacterium]|nr:exonuclease domain-containing protein [Pseudomonadota bacterium]